MPTQALLVLSPAFGMRSIGCVEQEADVKGGLGIAGAMGMFLTGAPHSDAAATVPWCVVCPMMDTCTCGNPTCSWTARASAAVSQKCRSRHDNQPSRRQWHMMPAQILRTPIMSAHLVFPKFLAQQLPQVELAWGVQQGMPELG